MTPEEQAAAEAAKQAEAEKQAAAQKKAEDKAAADAKKAEEKAAKDAEKAAAKEAKEAAKKAATEQKEAEKLAKAEAKEKAKADAIAAREAARQPEKNGIRRPKPEGLCGQAWAIFDSVSARNGAPASIKESLEVAKEQALNEGNVKAEYARWRKFYAISGRVAAPAPVAPVVAAETTGEQAAPQTEGDAQ